MWGLTGSLNWYNVFDLIPEPNAEIWLRSERVSFMSVSIIDGEGRCHYRDEMELHTCHRPRPRVQ